jgi:hypothetical protein
MICVVAVFILVSVSPSHALVLGNVRLIPPSGLDFTFGRVEVHDGTLFKAWSSQAKFDLATANVICKSMDRAPSLDFGPCPDFTCPATAVGNYFPGYYDCTGTEAALINCVRIFSAFQGPPVFLRCVAKGACATSPCSGNSICVPGATSDTRSCLCPPGYTGASCNVDINECQSSPCRNGHPCVNSAGSFTCECGLGYYGTFCESVALRLIGPTAQAGHVQIYKSRSWSLYCVSATSTSGSIASPATIANAHVMCRMLGYQGAVEQGCPTCSPAAAQLSIPPGANPAQIVYTDSAMKCVGNETDLFACPSLLSGNAKLTTASCTVNKIWAVVCTTGVNGCLPTNPCLNSGKCYPDQSTFVCVCPDGFLGSRCETNVDDCQGSQCMQGGTCIDGANSYACSCPSGFTGARCETNVNECLTNPCNGNGLCADGVNSYVCTCSTGYTGLRCQTNINDCVPDSCSGNGQCTDGVNSFACACNPGYTGPRCQTNINDCAPDSCSGNGQCTDGVGSVECTCSPGYTGPRCQTNINDCAPDSCSGNGQCTDGVGSVVMLGSQVQPAVRQCLRVTLARASPLLRVLS